jgi:hypothetical protein
LAGTRLHNFHRRNCWVWPLVLADRPLLHGPRRTIRPAASGVRVDFERVVPWRPYDPKVDCRWAARDLRRRHYASKIERSTNLNLEVASWRLPSLALFGHGATPDLCPLCATRRTSADRSEFMGSRSSQQSCWSQTPWTLRIGSRPRARDRGNQGPVEKPLLVRGTRAGSACVRRAATGAQRWPRSSRAP